MKAKQPSGLEKSSNFSTLVPPLLLNPDCQAAMGMQSKEIKDTQISASTTYNLHKPHYGRINLASFGGDPARTSWCATKDDKDPYLEIALPELTSFTGVATQVRLKFAVIEINFLLHPGKEFWGSTCIRR